MLSHHDAKKHRQWLNICIKQLTLLGYSDVELIGSGAFGFVFAGVDDEDLPWVFKFSRITLAQSVRDRLEDEAYMLSQVNIRWCQNFMPLNALRHFNDGARSGRLRKYPSNKGALVQQKLWRWLLGYVMC